MEKYLILGIVLAICAVIIYITIRKVKKKQQELKLLSTQLSTIEELRQQKQQEYEQYENDCNVLLTRKQKAKTEIDLMEEYNKKMRDQADESAQAYYDSVIEKTKQNIEKAIEAESDRYREAQMEFESNYHQVMRDMAATAAQYGHTAQKLIKEIGDLESKQRAAIEAHKRAAEEKDKIEFYRIQIPDSDLLEISKLREILPYLRDQDTLNKVIYKIYYENPVNDLIGRVVGKKQSGIYKITNIHNGKCYVGQAVNFANRWKQHIKRGVGAEPITHNKLYPAMLGDGVENFTFEVIEECPQIKLNEREDYWQKFFGAKEYGYSIK